MDPAISICPAVAAWPPTFSDAPFGVMVKSASKLAAAAPAAYIVAAYVAGTARVVRTGWQLRMAARRSWPPSDSRSRSR